MKVIIFKVTIFTDFIKMIKYIKTPFNIELIIFYRNKLTKIFQFHFKGVLLYITYYLISNLSHTLYKALFTALYISNFSSYIFLYSVLG